MLNSGAASLDAKPARVSGRRAGRVGQLPWAFMLPAVLLVVSVTFLPIVYAVNLSVHDTFFFELGDFIGLKHYQRFLNDPLSRVNLGNSVLFTAGSLTLSLSLGLGLALLLNRPFRGRLVFRTALILPWVVSQLMGALLWNWLYSPSIGPLGYVLGLLTGARVDILNTPDTAMLGVIIASVWRSYPYGMILLLAALQTIPSELYEAAKIDGAGQWKLFRFITFPMIRNTFLIVTIILSIHYFNMIEIPYVLTGGGPVNRTDVIGLRVFREAFVLFDYGFGAAISMIMFGINILVSLVYIRILRTEAHY